jgi:hypothetical protein
MITLYKANLTNYEVRFSIISILNDGIEKKNQMKKKRLKTIRVNLSNSQLRSWNQNNLMENKSK